jgi:catechol 2,3-dioxygenase-like lactoylglutathione lyase family enzyme
MTEVRSVVHTGITVRDLDTSVSFWRDALGFVVNSTFDDSGARAERITGVRGAVIRGAVLTGAGGHTVELLEYVEPADRGENAPRPCDVGAMHLALSVADLDAALARAAHAGWHPVRPVPPADGTTRYVYLYGPDGTTVEFVDPA